MTGETFSAGDALAWGLVEEVHPQALLGAACEELLDKLLEAEPRAVQIQKALMQRWEELPMTQAIAAGVDAFEDAWTTDEPSQSMARFLGERKAAKARG
jgi:enoyl-CoA hydratase/carnithine racemase